MYLLKVISHAAHGKAKHLLVVYLLITFSLPLYSQDPTLRFEHLTVKEGLAQNGVFGICEDKYGFMWFGTWNGLCRYDGYNFTVYQPDQRDSNSLVNNRILSVYKDSIGDIWISFSNSIEVCRYNYERDNFSRFTLTDVDSDIVDSLNRYRPFVQSTAHTKNHTWKIQAPDKELVQINKQSGKKIVYKPDPLDARSLNDEFLTELYLGSNRILWVGTLNNGINKADTRQKPFNLYYRSNHNKVVLNDVRAICTDNENNIWVGTRDKGLIKINRSTNEYRHFEHGGDINKNDYNLNMVRKIYCDRLGLIWIGTKAGLQQFNPKTNTFKTYTISTKNSIPHNWVFEIMEDHNGHLLIGTFGGIAKYHRKEDRFVAYPNAAALSSPKVRAIIEDRHFNLWVATEEGGLTCLKRDPSHGPEEKFSSVHYMQDATDIHTISSNDVCSLDEDENGFIWLATPNGLNCLDPSTEKFKRISYKEGLPDRRIVGVICDQDGYVWAGHTKGLSRLDTESMEIITYCYEDGLQDIEFCENACYRDKKTEELFFGGIHGVNAFFPDEITENPYVPEVYITGLQILNKKIAINRSFNGSVVLSKPLYLTDEITFNYRDRTIGLEFAGLHFSNPKGNRYKYKLEGFDEDWIETDASKRIAYYSNLEPRSYVFKVMAANADGVWNPAPAVLNINVLPPWWKTSWAKAIYIMIGFGVCYLVFKITALRKEYQHQIAIAKIKADKLAEFDNMKSTFFVNVAHELRTPLSLIIDPLERLIQTDPPSVNAKKYFLIIQRNAKRLYQLTNQLLDFRKLETGNLRLSLSLHDIVYQIKKVARSFDIQALQRNIKFTFNCREEKLLFSYDFNKMETILYNLISNAFKYTPDNGEISIQLLITGNPCDNLESRILEISISDNGIGIKQESLSSIFKMFYQEQHDLQNTDKSYGIGLAFTKELVELQGGTIAVESKEGKGSCFKVRFPFCSVVTKEVKNNNKPTPIITKDEMDFVCTKEQILSRPENPATNTSILIIEDNGDIRKYLAAELGLNFSIYESPDGTDGFEKAVQHLPDLIISDIMMPGMDGIELCRTIKSDVRTSHIPVILLTARQSEEHMIEGYETGADSYIVKPFSTAFLVTRIKNLIESRQRLREMFGKGLFIDTKAITNNVTDEIFIKKAIKVINDDLAETDFTSETLSTKLRMSRALLYKKIRSLSGMSVHSFIMTIRMNKAAEFLLSGEYKISEVAYKVGFSVVGNFSRSFVKQFGLTPSKFILKHKNNGE